MKEFLEAIKVIRNENDLTQENKYIPDKDLKGIIRCPKCGGELHYSISSYNGHIWGKCETEDCLSWMM